jgi:hypothetical protein
MYGAAGVELLPDARINDPLKYLYDLDLRSRERQFPHNLTPSNSIQY